MVRRRAPGGTARSEGRGSGVRTVPLPPARAGLDVAAVSGALLARAVAASAGWRPLVAVHGPGEPERRHRRPGLPVESLELDLALPAEGAASRTRQAAAVLRLSLAADRCLARPRPALVHDLAALAWGPPPRRRGIPVVWHVRHPSGTRALDVLRPAATTHLVYVSEAARLRFAWAPRLPAGTTVHNGLDLGEFRDHAGLTAALRRVLTQPALRLRLAAAGRATVERRFSAVRTGQAVLEIYERPLGDRS